MTVLVGNRDWRCEIEGAVGPGDGGRMTCWELFFFCCLAFVCKRNECRADGVCDKARDVELA